MSTPDREHLQLPDVVRQAMEDLDDAQHEMVRRLGLLAPQPADYVPVEVPREPDRVQLHDVPVTHFEQRPIGAYTAPQPPPADMPVDPVKWGALSRKRRRQMIRFHRKQVRGQ